MCDGIDSDGQSRHQSLRSVMLAFLKPSYLNAQRGTSEGSGMDEGSNIFWTRFQYIDRAEPIRRLRRVR